MYISLKLYYAKFDVSRLFYSKVIEEKHLGVGSTPPPTLVKEGLSKGGEENSPYHALLLHLTKH